MIVVDCSYTMAMVMPDEHRPSTLATAEAAPLVVPAVWALEVANAFRNAVRRGRIGADRAAALCLRLEGYEVSVDGGDIAVHRRFVSANTWDLSAYDAAYLELAVQRRCPLATLDDRMAAAAVRVGLTVLN